MRTVFFWAYIYICVCAGDDDDGGDDDDDDTHVLMVSCAPELAILF